MKLNEIFSVSPAKVELLKAKIDRLHVDLRLVEEQFTKGSGKGGQKRNKTSNTVVLKYPSLKLVVKVGRERQRNVNRFLALRELVDKIEMKISPAAAYQSIEREKIKKQKDRRARRRTPKQPPLL